MCALANERDWHLIQSSWEEVGTWTTGAGGLDIKDIVWPGGSHVPPEGVPEKFHVKIRRVHLRIAT